MWSTVAWLSSRRYEMKILYWLLGWLMALSRLLSG